MKKIAIVGAGLIGRSWAIVFARGGWSVRLTDPDDQQLRLAKDRIQLTAQGIKGIGGEGARSILGRITNHDRLEGAILDADLVQECGPENVELKRELFAALDRHASPGTILTSSTSTIVASSFTETLAGRSRCLVAHPINPPHLIPLVELCGAPWTDSAAVDTAHAFYESVGQVPIRIRKEINGFAANRLQVALLSEAIRLVSDGIVSPQDLDETICNGLGLRWSFMGPFATIELNAPGGIVDYFSRFSAAFREIAASFQPAEAWARMRTDRVVESWNSASVEERDALSGLRDRQLNELQNLKALSE